MLEIVHFDFPSVSRHSPRNRTRTRTRPALLARHEAHLNVGLACDRSFRHRARFLGVGLKKRIDGAEPVPEAPAGQSYTRRRTAGLALPPQRAYRIANSRGLRVPPHDSIAVE